MAKLILVWLILSSAFISSAQASRGVNAAGKCVEDCSRGSRSCPPCLPMIGPGSDQFGSELERMTQQNKQFRSDADATAKIDKDYRQSGEYAKERREFRTMDRSIDRMRDFSRVIG